MDERREERKREEGRRSGGGLTLRSWRETDTSDKLPMYGRIEEKRERKERCDEENEWMNERERERPECVGGRETRDERREYDGDRL